MSSFTFATAALRLQQALKELLLYSQLPPSLPTQFNLAANAQSLQQSSHCTNLQPPMVLPKNLLPATSNTRSSPHIHVFTTSLPKNHASSKSIRLPCMPLQTNTAVELMLLKATSQDTHPSDSRLCPRPKGLGKVNSGPSHAC
jgi:hypothetical protein